MKKPVVGIIIGSRSELPTMNKAVELLEKFGIGYELRVLSAHRSPKETYFYATAAEERGIKVIIAGAGGAAHLAGTIAAHTHLPVIGVPMESKYLKGIDSLFSTVQMPAGVPVATMAIGASGAKNAAILCAQILGLSNERIEKKLKVYKRRLALKVKRG
jgi:phosphoribosylaminoimidazole carboxylase PurE protein